MQNTFLEETQAIIPPHTTPSSQTPQNKEKKNVIKIKQEVSPTRHSLSN